VTVTWPPVPAPDRRAAVVPRALAAAADRIAPVLADVAITSIRPLVQRGHRGRPVASAPQRQLVWPRGTSLARPVTVTAGRAMVDVTVRLAIHAGA